MLNIQIGIPYADHNGVTIPVGMTVSDDDGDDDDAVPELFFSWFEAFLTHERILQGRERVTEALMNLVTEYIGVGYSGNARHRIRQAFIDFTEKTDLTPLSKDWFENPVSATLH